LSETLILSDLPVGRRGIIYRMSNEGSLRRRLQDLGFVEDAEVEKVSVSPLGDPSAYLIRGAVIAVRRTDASRITVHPLPGSTFDD
jgi:ferrous iron transport protein A